MHNDDKAAAYKAVLGITRRIVRSQDGTVEGLMY